MNDIVRTRFAPSPTGYLHIGGARTALFNFLLARKLGGKFVLRIEDTDSARNLAGADLKIMADLRWLGLEWDEGPQIGGPTSAYYQSQRMDRYKEVVSQLLDNGQAYYAFETNEELAAMRGSAESKGLPSFKYPRSKILPSETDATKAREEGRPVVVRFRMPGHDFEVSDQVFGTVRKFVEYFPCHHARRSLYYANSFYSIPSGGCA